MCSHSAILPVQGSLPAFICTLFTRGRSIFSSFLVFKATISYKWAPFTCCSSRFRPLGGVCLKDLCKRLFFKNFVLLPSFWSFSLKQRLEAFQKRVYPWKIFQKCPFREWKHHFCVNWKPKREIILLISPENTGVLVGAIWAKKLGNELCWWGTSKR